MRRGNSIGKWKLQRKLGAGNYGEVWAVKAEGEPEIALKILPVKSSFWFDSEAQILNILKGKPQILQFVCEYENDQYMCIGTEILGGQMLREWIDEILDGKRESIPEEIWRIVLRSAEALKTVHEAFVAHRDIKPQNFQYDGKDVYLVDFGFSGLTQTDDPKLVDFICKPVKSLGSPGYMAPEVWLAEENSDPRSADVFGFAVTIHLLLTGDRMFEGETSQEIKESVFSPKPKAISTLIPEVDKLLGQMTDPDWRLRPTMPQVVKKLAACNPDWETVKLKILNPE